jgi:hypothetical protein
MLFPEHTLPFKRTCKNAISTNYNHRRRTYNYQNPPKRVKPKKTIRKQSITIPKDKLDMLSHQGK